VISAVRGRGLMLAFDLPTAQWRDGFWKGSYELGLLVIRSGERSIRLRPMLDITPEVIDQALGLMKLCCKRLEAARGTPKP
jgi:L-lysine 6-transaminase